MATRLRRAGLSYVVLEKAGGIGGTWRENTYPGAGCDVPSGRNTNNWPTYPFRYRRQLRRFDLRDYRVSPSAQPGS